MSTRRKHPPEFMAKVVMEILSGAMTTLAAWMLLGRLEASVPTLGVGLTLNVVAAAVIGGVSLKGGEGLIIGAFAGVLFLAMVNNALNLMNVAPLWVNAVRGLIILVALIIDAQKSRATAAVPDPPRPKRKSRPRRRKTRRSPEPQPRGCSEKGDRAHTKTNLLHLWASRLIH